MNKPARTIPMWYRLGMLGILGGAVLFSGAAIVRGLVSDSRSQAGLISDVILLMTDQHVDEPTPDELTESALAAIAASVDDPFTVYIPPALTDAFEKDLTGSYSGIGATIEMRDAWLTIVSPLEDSPAYRQGLLPDDRIVEIDGESTLGITTNQAVDRLTGEPDTDVVLTIERAGEGDEPDRFEVTITRAPIVARTVKGLHRDPSDPERWLHAADPEHAIAYIRIAQFTDATAQEFDEAIDAIQSELGEPAGLILDLRGNPGGLMATAIHVADRLLDSGVIVAAEGPSVPSSAVNATKSETRLACPIIVLINSASASASEILAGAIQGNGRGVVLGSRSFGKGSIQQIWPLREGEAGHMKITQALYKVATPEGTLRSVHRRPDSLEWGIDPSPGMYLPMTLEQLIAAREARLAIDRLALGEADATGIDWAEPETALESLQDPQLLAAYRALRDMISTGQWGRPGEDPPEPGQVAADEIEAIESLRASLLDRITELEERLETLRADPRTIDPRTIEPESESEPEGE